MNIKNDWKLSTKFSDEQILNELKPWKELANSYRQVLGTSALMLDRDTCEHVECEIGDIITDAFLSFYRKRNNYTKPAISLMQAGGIRSGLSQGCKHIVYSKFTSITNCI